MLHSETVGIRKPGPHACETKKNRNITTELIITLCYHMLNVLNEGLTTQAAVLTCHGGRGELILV